MENDELVVIVVGLIKFNDYNLVKNKLDEILLPLSKEYNIVIVSGAAEGIDKMGVRYAIENNFKLKVFELERDKYGDPQAWIINNNNMIKIAHLLIAFWDGLSKGTG